MTSIVLGVGASHTTLMNTRWAEVDHLERAHAFRDGLALAKERLVSAEPDLVVIVGSNHFRGFWLDLMPSFTIGVGRLVAAGEHGTPEGSQETDPEAAINIADAMIARHFDIAFSSELNVDHGISHAIQYLVPDGVPVLPVIINAFAPPLPTLFRTVAFGEALGRSILDLAGDRRVAVVATGGLSHSLPFPDWRHPNSDDDEFLVDSWKNGRGNWSDYEQRRRSIIIASPSRINEEFDRQFLADLAAGKAPGIADRLSNDDLVAQAGNGGNEIRAWLTMAAATGCVSGDVLAYSPMPEWLTGMAVATFEPSPIAVLAKETK